MGLNQVAGGDGVSEFVSVVPAPYVEKQLMSGVDDLGFVIFVGKQRCYLKTDHFGDGLDCVAEGFDVSPGANRNVVERLADFP